MMYPNATHGLERVYQSQVIALVAAVLMIIPVINILAAIALIVSLVLYMIGINEAGKDDESYKTAFTLIIVQLVISVLNSLIGGVIFDLVNEALALAVLYFVCITTNKLLKNIGADGRITDRGVVVWKINVICTIVEVVCTLLALIPSFPAAAGGRCDTGDGHRANRRIHPVYPVPAGCHHGAEIHWRTGSGCICRTGAVNTIWQ